MTTGSAINPRKALGKPRRLACQDRPTTLQEIFDEISQDRAAVGLAARVMASADRTREAMRPRTLDTSISV